MDFFRLCKHLFIVLYCLNDAVSNLKYCKSGKDIIICEDDNCTLQCGQIGSIHIISANYGRTNKDTCTHQANNDVTCSAPNVIGKISEECENRSSCAIQASNGIFTDPCQGTYKYVNLTYTCSVTPQTGRPTTKKVPSTTQTGSSTTETGPSTTVTVPMAYSTSNTTVITQIVPSSSRMIGIIVGVVVFFVIMLICSFVVLYRRLKLHKLQKKDPGLEMDSVNNPNYRPRDDNTTRTNDYQPYGSNSVYHQYSEISSSTTKADTCAEYSTCIPEYSYASTVPENNLDYKERDKNGGYSSDRSDFKGKDKENDGSYFVLDPKETGIDRLTKSNKDQFTVDYELAQSTDQNGSMDIYTVGHAQYEDFDEYTHVQNTNQLTVRQEGLYDRATDGLYDVSSHERRVTIDGTYDHFNGIK